MVAPWITRDLLAYPDSPFADTAIEYASYVLYRLTGEKYPGVSSTIETYVYESFGEHGRTIKEFAEAQIVGIPNAVTYPQRLYLRGAPVHAVNDVYVDGEPLDPSRYSLYNKRFLKLNEGINWSSICNVSGVTVDYTYGMSPPKAGILACTTLANELLILLGEGSSDVGCRIPERVKSVTREGISFDLIDPQEFLDDGRTGIWEVDLFIRTANPARSKKPPRLLSPSDARRYRR